VHEFKEPEPTAFRRATPNTIRWFLGRSPSRSDSDASYARRVVPGLSYQAFY